MEIDLDGICFLINKKVVSRSIFKLVNCVFEENEEMLGNFYFCIILC